MSLREDVTAARQAVQVLEQATAAVTSQFGDTVDVRRLRTDVARLTGDLDLLCGPSRAAPPVQVLEVIDDSAYAPDFWRDAEDEGLGSADRRAP